jgi:DNA invertase Pin-like site-specific DNA recombinase
MIRERVKAGIAQARAEGKPHGRPRTAAEAVFAFDLADASAAGTFKDFADFLPVFFDAGRF